MQDTLSYSLIEYQTYSQYFTIIEQERTCHCGGSNGWIWIWMQEVINTIMGMNQVLFGAALIQFLLDSNKMSFFFTICLLYLLQFEQCFLNNSVTILTTMQLRMGRNTEDTLPNQKCKSEQDTFCFVTAYAITSSNQ